MRSTCLALALLMTAACPKPQRAAACAAGETNRCSCAGGGEGLQSCLPAGDAFGACVCSAACANGAACVPMPALVGKDLDGAGALVEQAGLLLPDPVDPQGFITVQQIADPPVQVLAQNPPAGTPVKPGTRIVLTVTLPPDQETLGLPTSNFLVGNLKQDTADSAQAYYDALDPGPFPTRATFADWKAANGFGTPADAEASALYVTHTDLGFGRHMHMRRKGKRVAFYVDNYPGVDDAIAGTHFFATVAMEYSPGPRGKDTDPYFTQFYVFNKKGARITDPILDDHGPKQSPAVCTVCHGGSVYDLTYGNGGNIGAHFIPFDVDAEQFSDRPGYTRADQEGAFKAFNEAVQITWDLNDPTYPPGDPSPVPGLIDGWYGGAGHPSPVFLSGATPAGWDVSPVARALYHQVFAKSCQTCHAQREASRNFSTYAKFAAETGLIAQRVFDEGAMPLSQRGSLNFWLSYPQQPKILATWLGTPLRAPGKPIARLSVTPSTLVTAGTQVTLDGSQSQYAVAFNWQETSGPAVQLTNAAPDGSKVFFVTPPLGASFTFQLTASNEGRVSAPVSVNVLSRSAPSAPQSVSATPGAASATVSWTAPATDGLSPITGYTIGVTPGGASVSVAPSANSAVVDGLQPGLTYTFSVAAQNAIGTGSAASTGPVRIPTVPGPPVGVSAVSPHTGGALVVSWTAPADNGGSPISAYHVACTPSGSATAAGSATNATVTGLTNTTSYTCKVSATNIAGTGPASLGATGIPDGPPSPPLNFTATPLSSTSEHLAWSAPANDGGFAITDYIVTYTPSSGTPTTIDTKSTALSYDVNGLSAGTSYTFTVAAKNSAGIGLASSTAPPGTPVITSPASNSFTGATVIPVTWTDSGTITSFTVQAKLAGTTTVAQTVTVSGTTFSATLTGLSNCTSYDVYVIATNNAGSATASVSNVTPLQAPDVPTGLKVTKGAGVGDFSLLWSASNGHGCAVQYIVQVTDPVSGVLTLSPVTSTNLAYNTTNPACPYPSTIDCINSPRTWSFSVEAQSSGGTSAFSTAMPWTPRTGYRRETIYNIWSTVLPAGSATTCLNCHYSLSGNVLILDEGAPTPDPTHHFSWNNITTTTNVVIVSSPSTSLLHECPTGTNCSPPGMGVRYPAGSIEDNLIVQWITDGALF